MTDRESDRERRERILNAVLKVLGVAVAIGIAIGIGTWVMVKSLGLDNADTSTVGPAPVTPIKPLPTTAITQTPDGGSPTDEPTDEPTDIPTEIVTPSAGSGDLFLSASPVFVKSMERINLTGQWPGKDNVSLLVQRFENGEWVDFGVQVTVQVGTFETYVMTGREGDNKFRVYDPETGTSSNEVKVTIEG
ncbi:hypothetical protein [Nocardioides marmorisolisilvae]|uniref:Uncharacterized protein n=1 Tax=Nocardioides marmorisolisilvae TaxID=1542737 RepID=A0A3N0DPX3_9ACTN|nr:hypothetical protein [Nocardioides marmorisolisilvae]RNL77692.1 hypothetical protein EFL95_16940 [Nocardioides marmorisolisilvae]